MAKLLQEITNKEVYTSLNYQTYVNAYKNKTLGIAIAKHFQVPLELVLELASDPDHAGKHTVSSFIEAMVALEIEKDSMFEMSIHRGKKETDLKDGWNRMWDVKAPPSIPFVDFNEEMQKAVSSIIKKLEEFPKGDLGILLCVSFLKKADYMVLQQQLKNTLSTSEKFLIRAIHIDGVLNSCATQQQQTN